MNTLRDAGSGIPEVAPQLGIQTAGDWQAVAGLRQIHGRAPLLLHHGPVGARLGAATIDRATRRMGAPPECGAHFRAPSECHRSTHADSAAGLVALPTEAGATLPVLRGRDPQLTARRSPDALSLERGKAATVDVLLSIRTTECFRSTPRRSTQPRTARCGSEGGGVDDPRRQVRQVSPRAFACFDLCGAGGLPRPTSAPLGGTSGVLLFVRLQLGQSFGWRRDSSNVLCLVAADRSAGPLRQSWPSSARHAAPLRDEHPRAWYRSGQDPERRLPLLSAYLGHVHVADTQWYLEGSPELMREAMRRLEQRWEGRP
jgi:hypothetical protein